MRFHGYETGDFHDEMFLPGGTARREARLLVESIESLSSGELLLRQRSAERTLLEMGITFNVYGHGEGTEKIFPFDLIPRIVSAADWAWLERGLKQRITALNLFIDDVYHEQKIKRLRAVMRCFKPRSSHAQSAADTIRGIRSKGN